MRGRWFIVSVGAGVVAVPWAFAVQRLLSPHSPVSGASPTSLVWGDRVFSSPRPFADWLSAHGRQYRGWVPLHPQGIAILTHQPYPPPSPLAGVTAAARSGATTANANPAVAKANPAIIGGAPPRSDLKLAVQILVLVLASVLLASAFTPGFLLRRGPPRLRYLVQANRAYVAVVAIAILVGYAVQGLG
jgi:hypothetical protein